MHYSISSLETGRYPYGKIMSVEGNMCCNLSYPETYYKVQPFVMAVCDQMNGLLPSQELFDEISNDIYLNVCMMYPDLAEYVNGSHIKPLVESQQRDRNFGFRRKSPFQDFIDIILLNELFRRIL